MSIFTEVNIKNLNQNPFQLIGDDWMLVTAGNKNNFNTMTASWGGLGVLWNKNVAFKFIRPQRYTFDFMEKHDYYTLSFYDDKFKDALKFCGKNSGRDVDKTSEINFTPVFEDDFTYFNEARLVLVCKKIYEQFIDPNNFLDEKIQSNYPNKDYHKMYVGEITKVLVKEG